MIRGRPPRDGYAPIKDRIALAEALLNCRWDLPIVFELEGDRLVGTCTMAVAADINECSIKQAQADIALAMKAAIMCMVDKAKKPA